MAIVAPQDAEELVSSLKSYPDGKDAAIIGEIKQGDARVILQTVLGGERVLE